MPHLTERQRQCLEGFLARKTAKQIGRDLGITHHAVEQHLKAARRKLGAADTLEAARIYAGHSDATAGPYYAAPEVSDDSITAQGSNQPKPEVSVLRDVAAEDAGVIQSLSARQTLIAIGLCGFGMVTILSLIVAVASGVAQLAP
jgi:DNA-binding CsgD family transcriptional regulator